jgi:hypothetical protein
LCTLRLCGKNLTHHFTAETRGRRELSNQETFPFTLPLLSIALA